MSAQPSARGIFRATAPKARHGERPREADDFYPTPPEPTLALLASSERHTIRRLGTIWEPCAGDGAMADVLRTEGLSVVSSDLVARGARDCYVQDFYAFERPFAPSIITNPPYSEVNSRGKGRWLRHTFALGVTYCALLLNADWPFAAAHSALLDRHPISRIHAMRWKIDFTGGGSPPQRNIWCVWDSAHVGPTTWHVMDRAPGRLPLRAIA